MVMIMVMNDPLPPPLCNVNRPSHSEIQLFQNLTMKIHGQGHVCGQSSRSHSKVKVMVKFKPIGHIWGLEFSWYVCFSNRGNRTTFGWDIGNSIFGKFKVKVMVKFKPIGHIWGLEFNRYVCFSFHGNRTTFGWDIGNSIFDLENSRSRSWPRSNPMVTFEP